MKAYPLHARSSCKLTLVSLAALLMLATGCASDPPGSREAMRLDGTTMSSLFWPGTEGRSVQLDATVRSRGSVVPAVRVVVTSESGAPTADAPTVVVTGEGVAVDSVTTQGNTQLVRFRAPGLEDGAAFTLDVTAPDAVPSPYRVRVTPILLAPSENP